MKLTTAIYRSLEWRLLSILVDLVIVYLITGQVVLSASIVGATALAKIAILAGWIKIRMNETVNSCNI